MCAEQAKRLATPADERTHAADNAMIKQQRRRVKARFGSQIVNNHRRIQPADRFRRLSLSQPQKDPGCASLQGLFDLFEDGRCWLEVFSPVHYGYFQLRGEIFLYLHRRSSGGAAVAEKDISALFEIILPIVERGLEPFCTKPFWSWLCRDDPDVAFLVSQ